MKIKKLLCIVLSVVTMLTAVLSVGATAFAADGSKVTFDLNKTSVTTSVGKEFRLKCDVKSGVIDTVTYASSNTKVAKVNKSGYVTAKGLGTAKITVTVNSKYKKTCKVTVNKAYYVVKLNGSRTLPTINGKSYTGWKSSAKSKIKVSGKKLYGKKDKSSAKLTKTVNKKKYTICVYCISDKSLKAKIKKELGKEWTFVDKSYSAIYATAGDGFFRKSKAGIIVSYQALYKGDKNQVDNFYELYEYTPNGFVMTDGVESGT